MNWDQTYNQLAKELGHPPTCAQVQERILRKCFRKSKPAQRYVSIAASLLLLLVFVGGCSNNPGAKMINTGDQELLIGNYTSAAEQYQRAQKLGDGDRAHLRLATALLKTYRYSDALTELAKVSMGSHKADYLRAVCYLNLNDVANAQQHLEQALQGKPDDSLALALLGRIKFLQKQYAQSIETYQSALAASSSQDVRTKIHYNMAMAQLLAGRFEDADTSFKLYLVKQNYVTKEDHRAAGAVAYAIGDNDRALRHWQKLNNKERQEILNAIADESRTFGELAVAK